MKPRVKAKFGEALTPTEISVLRLKCAGLCDKQIAARLNCSTRTVNNHCWRIFRKAGCHGAALGVWAVRHGYVEVEPEGATE